MPSPFPGMNPFLEQPDAWHDFHERFSPAVAEALTAQLRPKYFAKIDEHVFLHELSADERRLIGRADVAVTRRLEDPGTVPGGGVASAAVIGLVPLGVDEERLSFLQIVDRETREVVTAVELLSPSNKSAGDDRGQYLAKRSRLLAGSTHLVEIDLLRGGRRPPINGRPDCDYCVMVSRADMRPRVELWPFRLRDPLPLVPVPLRAPDPDAVIDLKAVLDRVYDGAGYEDYIYAGAPDPPLDAADADWAAGLLAGTQTGEMTPLAS